MKNNDKKSSSRRERKTQTSLAPVHARIVARKVECDQEAKRQRVGGPERREDHAQARGRAAVRARQKLSFFGAHFSCRSNATTQCSNARQTHTNNRRETNRSVTMSRTAPKRDAASRQTTNVDESTKKPPLLVAVAKETHFGRICAQSSRQRRRPTR